MSGTIHFKAKQANICWFQLLKCESLMLFRVIHDSKLNSFGFLDCWSDKASYLKASLLAAGK